MVATFVKEVPSYVTIKRWMFMVDRQVTERHMAGAVKISRERVHSILTEGLYMRNLSTL